MRVRWTDVVRAALRVAGEFRDQYGHSLTLRGLFYRLVSIGAIPNTRSAYKRLSAVLAEARYRGEFPWGLIRDETRPWAMLEPAERPPPPPMTREELVGYVRARLEYYYDAGVNPWLDQPRRVIVVVEKLAMYDAVRHAVQGFPHGVYSLRATRGYDSATDVKRVADDVRMIAAGGQTPVVLVLSDFDPSGEDIARDLRERLEMLAGAPFVYEKVAVTKEQVERYGLPARPEDAEEIGKMIRDPRFKRWPYGLYRVELDAFDALHPDEFRRIIVEAVAKHFDDDIYERVTRPRAEEARELARENLQKTLALLSGFKGPGTKTSAPP